MSSSMSIAYIEKEEYNNKSWKSMYVVVIAAVIASAGGVLFGYDIGITSGALLQLKDEFSLTSFEQELIVSAVLVGAFFASIFGGNIVDSWGRKVGIIVSCCLFIVGSLILSFSINFIMLIVGRFIVGIAVSLSVTAECTYISEISPPAHRGMMVSLNELGITIGFLLAYSMNYIFIKVDQGWKYMFGAAAILALVQMIGIAFMPSSHHYLIIKGNIEKARKVLSSLRNGNVDEEIEAISSSIAEQKSRKYIDLFSSSNNMRGRMFLGMALVFLQQFSGHANVLYYAPTVFQLFGFDTNTSATLVTVGLGVVKVAATLFTLLIVDKVGRRSLLLTGTLLMASSLLILGIVGTMNGNNASRRTTPQTLVIHHHPIVLQNNKTNMNEPFSLKDYEIERKKNTAPNNEKDFLGNKFQETNSSISDEDFTVNEAVNSGQTQVTLTTKIISVVSLMIFVCAYGISYGPVTWLILSEIFPASLRGRAVSVATCINWGSNIVVSLTFLDILNAIGIGPTFIAYGFISFLAAIFIFTCVPETKSKTLEEINILLKTGLMHQDLKMCTVFAASYKKYTLKESSNSYMKTNSCELQEDKGFEHLSVNRLNPG